MDIEKRIREIAKCLEDIDENAMCVECKNILGDEDKDRLNDLDYVFDRLTDELEHLPYYYIHVGYADPDRYVGNGFYLGSHPSICCMSYEFPYATEEEARECIEKHPDIKNDEKYVIEIKKNNV